ncbi:hypothetical protein DICVIV_12109 [Dictyocaulus viviparus]|uniref:Amiloride-sensitive sodium channel n=1 Tax=Dictyocaulus viviparus TaxID=29172 RepID=A0A0D8XBB6_DICVI|nr:hypothetical protein DICVIV_12109 [Dictyocaulus viviparus]
MRSRIGHVKTDVGHDVIRYLIAGSGFAHVEVYRWNLTYRFELNNLYYQWRGNRTQFDMFDFVFNKNGYKCNEMFLSCHSGPREFDCCSAFVPTYVMLRGRCYRLIEDYYQSDIYLSDNLVVYFNQLQGLLLPITSRPQMIIYLGDEHKEIGLYPRIYLNINNWNNLRFIQRRITMLPERSLCSNDPQNQGISTCFVYNWVNRVMLPTLNCTLPFFKDVLPYTANLSLCEPLTVVFNYYIITSRKYEEYDCLPACERVENRWQMTTSVDKYPLRHYGFVVDVSFYQLEYDHYTETRLITPARFISELGNQISFFIGCSLMTFVQLLFTVMMFIFKHIRKTYHVFIRCIIMARKNY